VLTVLAAATAPGHRLLPLPQSTPSFTNERRAHFIFPPPPFPISVDPLSPPSQPSSAQGQAHVLRPPAHETGPKNSWLILSWTSAFSLLETCCANLETSSN